MDCDSCADIQGVYISGVEHVIGFSSWFTMRPSRGAAFAVHLLLSLLAFSSLVVMMLVYWFPGELFIMDGGWEGLKLVAMVDLVLGPALTLILFKPGKPGLKFDLSVIAAVQIAALGYGFHTTYNQRTVAVVYADNEFATVSAKDNRLANEALVKLHAQPAPLPSADPFSVPVLLTPTPENPSKYLQDILNGFPSAHERSDQYVSITSNREQLKSGRQSEISLTKYGALPELQRAAKKLKLALEDIEIYRFRARYAEGYVLFDPAQARILDYVRHDDSQTSSIVAEHHDS